MSQNQLQSQHPTAAARRAAALTVTAVALLGLGLAPASARPEAGPPVGPAAAAALVTAAGQAAQKGTDDDQCVLRRVAAQFTRCDDLTGNGVPAPAWIPER